ncbi:hypothetical protein [Paraflavitalea speifideaquila]|uniref:hypothetical protein n=1 Tax=Paraflavitalea speifideaquila TaxID=3076558 RepID=UPI0028EF7E2C|nr:hypothetical protein [Paraflavitalea speifideiaquila]
MQSTGFKKLPVNEKSLSLYTDNIIANKPAPFPAGLTALTPLFIVGKQTFRVKDWLAYLESIRGVEDLRAGKPMPNCWISSSGYLHLTITAKTSKLITKTSLTN